MRAATKSSTSRHIVDLPALDHSLDTPGPSVLSLEHINLEHPNQPQAVLFYTALLQCTIDPYRTCSSSTLWFNCGQQQFHIQNRPGKSSKTEGAVGLVLGREQWEQLESRWREIKAMGELKDTQLSLERRVADPKSAKARLVCEHWGVVRQVSEEKEAIAASADGVPYYHIVGPWGQLYEVFSAVTSTLDEQSMGMAYIEEVLPAAAIPAVGAYYQRYFKAATDILTDTDGRTLAAITVGYRQRLLFRSPAKSAATPIAPVDASWHYCIYLGEFAAIYRTLEADGLIHSWKEGRTDRVDNWLAAVDARQFRAFDMKGGRDQAVVWRIEQEVRSGKHRHYNRLLVNEEQPRPKQCWAELQVNGIVPSRA